METDQQFIREAEKPVGAWQLIAGILLLMLAAVI